MGHFLHAKTGQYWMQMHMQKEKPQMIQYPTRDEVIKSVADTLYSSSILNNSHRGDVVEMMVLAALGSEWKFVGLGWHPWNRI
jgi:hypothetical protein